MPISKQAIDRSIKQVAGKLVAEGLTSSTFTKAKAKKATKSVVQQTYVHKLIDGFSVEIKAEMKKLKKRK